MCVQVCGDQMLNYVYLKIKNVFVMVRWFKGRVSQGFPPTLRLNAF